MEHRSSGPPVGYMERTRRYYRALGYNNDYVWAHHEDAPFTRLSKPLSECTVALITTAGPPDLSNRDERNRKHVWSGDVDSLPATFDTDLAWDKEATHTDDRETFLPIDAARRLKLTQNVPFPLTAEMIAWSDPLILWLKWGFYGLAGLAVTIVALRILRRRFVETIEITYPGDRKVRAPAGPTLLEISRMNGIPHADVCGGRARCSTCRTRILVGAETLPPPAANEQKILARIGADETIRLACQIRPQSALNVQPLVPARGAAKVSGLAGDAYQWGVEQPAAILFVDLRDFTGLSEHRLSYDVVFLLNRYLGETAHAIEACGGYVDKFIGDGVMAIFGMTDGLQAGCRNALAATNAIAERMEHLNAELAGQLDTPLRVGMGLHAGPVILGRIGALDTNGVNARITALGDVVNTASRLESSSKELGHALVVSTTVLTAAGYSCDATREREIAIRGRKDPLRVYALDPPSPLADTLSPAARPSS